MPGEADAGNASKRRRRFLEEAAEGGEQKEETEQERPKYERPTVYNRPNVIKIFRRMLQLSEYVGEPEFT